MRRLLMFVLFAVAVTAVAAGALWYRVTAPYKGYDEAEKFVEVPPRSGPSAIGRALIDAGIVRDRVTWRLAIELSGAERGLHAGEYRFSEPVSARDVVARLAKGDVYLRPITFREGLSIAEMARMFEAQGLGSAAAFTKAASDASLVASLDPDAPDLEGYLFPETYGMNRRSSPSTLVRAMVARFEAVFGPELREAAKARGMSVREVVTVASLVEKETAKPDERPMVAAVYRNRLKIGMPLQCDPTVIYGLQRARRYDGNLTREDLAFDSPYNTYRYPGLPPGPIAAPGRGSLEAAVHPADVDYLFFVSRNDGSHIFSRTYEEHRRYVQEYQVRFFDEPGRKVEK